jgi:hypothetical protein
MMRHVFRYLIIIAVAGLLFLCACSPQAQAGENTSQASSASAQQEETNTASKEEAAAASEESSAEVECNWTLEVSDTVTTQLNGYDFKCTLAIMAVKLGGKDELGTYRGIVTLNYQYDMKQGNVAGNAAGEGQEIDAVIEVVQYEEQAYNEATGQTDLAELVQYDAMAIGSLALTGSGEATESAEGASWSTSDKKTIPVPYRMAIDGGKVTIELFTIAPGVKFNGMITGTPI